MTVDDSAHTHSANPGPAGADRHLPPIAELVVASVALMLAGGVYLAAHLPRLPPLAPAVGLLAAGGALTLVAMTLMSRIRQFAWATFFQVARWALVAYVSIAAILGFVFVYDRTRGSTLTVLILTLVVFAIDVPVVIAFTVARFQDVPGAHRS